MVINEIVAEDENLFSGDDDDDDEECDDFDHKDEELEESERNQPRLLKPEVDDY